MIHALVCFDYKGPDPSIPNVHAFGFMQAEERPHQIDGLTGKPVASFHHAQDLAHKHWSKHFTFRIMDKKAYEEQHTFAYEPAVLIEHLFNWGVDMSKFDPTLPRSAP